MTGAVMTHDAAVLKAREIASRVLAPSAGQNDKAGRFSTEAVASLRESGLLGLMLPADVGGLGLGPCTFAAVIATLAEADASVAMVYLMHGRLRRSTAINSGNRPVANVFRPISRSMLGFIGMRAFYSPRGHRDSARLSQAT
jgi:alkylation response protein AidB-like acyl-CoA dehydrogenase